MHLDGFTAYKSPKCTLSDYEAIEIGSSFYSILTASQCLEQLAAAASH